MKNTNSNRALNIALIPGDGIGREVVPEGVRVLEALASRYGFAVKFEAFPYGCEYYLKHGVMMPADGLEQLSGFDSILLGAVGDRKVPDHVSLWGLLIPIRRHFQQYVNLRPVRIRKSAGGSIRGPNRKPSSRSRYLRAAGWIESCVTPLSWRKAGRRSI
jgi:tartrate dehydrogenase/decarboxylase/D-malate dehydrogenase